MKPSEFFCYDHDNNKTIFGTTAIRRALFHLQRDLERVTGPDGKLYVADCERGKTVAQVKREIKAQIATLQRLLRKA